MYIGLWPSGAWLSCGEAFNSTSMTVNFDFGCSPHLRRTDPREGASYDVCREPTEIKKSTHAQCSLERLPFFCYTHPRWAVLAAAVVVDVRLVRPGRGALVVVAASLVAAVALAALVAVVVATLLIRRLVRPRLLVLRRLVRPRLLLLLPLVVLAALRAPVAADPGPPALAGGGPAACLCFAVVLLVLCHGIVGPSLAAPPRPDRIELRSVKRPFAAPLIGIVVALRVSCAAEGADANK